MNGTCSEQTVIQYIEFDLPEAEMLRAEHHFTQCPGCRELLARHRLLRNALQHSTIVPVPAGFARSILAALPPAPQEFLTTVREKVIATAAGIALATFGLALHTIGAYAERATDALSPAWWNGILIQLMTTVTEGFQLVLHLVRMLGGVGAVLLNAAALVLQTLGAIAAFSPAGRAVLVTLVLMSAAGALLTHRLGRTAPPTPIRSRP